ncbi:2'-5' RNA ligase [Oceanobacillus limi]|uniref:RNA 2',3'-cyclic phosphodiesterase n=1 Tax=Oceanobacillus limi TaxID=930131 RepID=A0A1I0HGY7_9BACI|nr:RNA 2',3'-cyclic phosphodiesterase [Oceanobacillus limi]SET82332.1 2'-5' RNA ligase [Oceanobacillus limi]
MSSPHFFIAIPLPKDLKDLLAAWQAELKEFVPYKQWPHVDDFHVTLKFLGAVPNHRLQKLINELEIIENFAPFRTTVATIDTFGKPDKPRVLWAGVEKTESLFNLQNTVDTCAANVGLPKENRPYRPHITLAKKWDGPKTDQMGTIKQKFMDRTFELQVREIVVYQIFPSQKPKYKVVNSFQLVGGE